MTAISSTTFAPRTERVEQERTVSAAAVSVSEEQSPNYVGIYIGSILAVSLVFLVGVGVPTALYLGDAMAGMGLGAFCAVWGGPSFGVMTGSARVSAWFEAHEDHAS